MNTITPLQRLRLELTKQKADAFLVTKTPNVQYISGFSGDDTYLLVTPKQAFLITDSRYTEQAQNEVSAFRIIEHKKGLVDKVIELVKKYRIKKLGFESDALSYAGVKYILKQLPAYTRLKSTQGVIVNIAAVKTPEEIECIRESVKCSHESFKEVKRLLKPGMTEQAVAAELEYRMRKRGSLHPAFESIIAADSRASLPHATAGDNKLKKGGFVLFDWGSCVNQYNSDTSRVVFLGKPSPFWRNIYEIVREAQQRAINLVKPGIDSVELDRAARKFIESKGYGKNFGHGLGHGVGRLVHELPRIRRYSMPASMKPKPYLLQPGMVFTIEPGIYLPGKGGIRIEDMVLVTEHGCEILTSSLPKAIEEMTV
ncbi:MAG: aminopeptidase P family protein [Planctomycetes bacterium]|nr:aminopeptidase P family protein [Planctomycetota bacterium]